ncbi:MAG: 16S rRNA (uracil(1498)-N(3))-methyltransferase [Alphaproteobacteria bacterium]|nr:16S rRNA (uracil(1498)-N(3))-methyltransferase [Alphaproteobacteria bacterium]
MALETRQRLYCTAPLCQDAEVTLDRDQSHYLLNVLRKAEGDELLLFNGKDGEWQAEITQAAKKAAVLHCLAATRPQDPVPSLMLVFAPIKKARIDFIAEKATELGVGILQPVMTDRTQMSRVNTDRMRANAIEAAEQTGRTTIPEIRAPISLTALLEDWPATRHIIFCDEDRAASPDHAMADVVAGLTGKAAIFIGPEGGFSPRERDHIIAQAQAHAVALGRNILRADTAMLAALAIWQSAAGEWKGRR